MFQVIPAIDVLDGNVVRLQRGSYEDVTVYGNDPVATALAFHREGATLVHVVDLAGARDGRPDRALRRRLGEAGVGFQVGGGMRTAVDVSAALEDGATRVVVGTAAVWNRELVAEMVATVGAHRLVAAVDVADGNAKGAGWLDEGRPVDQVTTDLLASGVTQALVTAISQDGTMAGPDLALLERVAAGGLQVIASGGVGTLDHLRQIRAAGIGAAIVGRAIYEGRFSVAEAIDAISR